MAGEKSGSRIAILAGLFAGALIAIMRYGVYHSVDVTSFSPETLTMMTVLAIGLDIFVVLAGLLCGYIVAATATGAWPAKIVFREAAVAGVFAGLVNLLAMALIYYPQVPERWGYDVLNLSLYGIWYFVQIVVLALAGGAIYTALVWKPRSFTPVKWPGVIAAGIVAAFVVAMAYYVQSLAVESYYGLAINGSIESLAVQFAVDAFVLVAGIATGIATARMMQKSAPSPASLVLCTATAGLLAGFFGLATDVLIKMGFPGSFSMDGLTGYDWLNYAMQVFYGSVLLMTLAVGGGVIYALIRRETGLVSADTTDTPGLVPQPE